MDLRRKRKTNDKGQTQVIAWVDAKVLEKIRSDGVIVSDLIREALNNYLLKRGS